jgi:hypothetical protein
MNMEAPFIPLPVQAQKYFDNQYLLRVVSGVVVTRLTSDFMYLLYHEILACQVVS